MIESLKKHKKDIIVLGLGNFLKIILTIIISRIVTHFLDYDDYAVFILLISIYNFFSLLLISPLGPFIIVNATEFLNNNTLYSFYCKLFSKYIIPVSFFAGLLMCVYYLFFDKSVGIVLILGIVLLLIFKSSFEIINQYFNLFKMNIVYVTYAITFLALNILIGLLSINIFGSNYLSWFFSFVIANIIIYASAFIKFKNLFNNSLGNIYFFKKKIYKFSSNIFLANIFTWIIYDGSKIFGEKIFDKSELGILFLGLAISAQIFSTVESFLNQLIIPWLFDNTLISSSEAKYIKLKKYFKIILPTLLILFFGSVLFSDLILYVLIDQSKNSMLLKNIFIVGLSIELVKSLINSLKNIFYINLKGWIISLSTLIGASTFIFFIIFKSFSKSIYDYSYYVLYSHIVTLGTFILLTIFYQRKWLNRS